jgi:antitoxin ParD1/3/4
MARSRGMAAKHSRHIALTEPLESYVEERVARGDYASASEMVRAGLKLLKERDETQAVRAERLNCDRSRRRRQAS